MEPSAKPGLCDVARHLEEAASILRTLAGTSANGLALIAEHEAVCVQRAEPDAPNVQQRVRPGPKRKEREPIELMTATAVAELLVIDVRTLRRQVRAGDFPEPISVGRAQRWRRTQVEAWITKRST